MTKSVINILNEKNYRSILALDGEIPYSIISNTKLPIIAADGAANKLHTNNLTPHIIIGDLDSVEKPLLSKYAYLHLPDQNSCDFEKCIKYLERENLLPTLIVGMDGGYLDHIVNNINIFLSTNSIFVTNNLIGFTLKANNTKNIEIERDTKLSLFGMPNAHVSTDGLKWELINKTLSFPGFNSCFNRMHKNTLKITVSEGALLILIYHTKVV